MNTLRNFYPITRNYQPLIRKKKTLKGTQEKVASISGPLTRLRHIVEAKWKALPGTDDEATSGHIEIAALLKQNILL